MNQFEEKVESGLKRRLSRRGLLRVSAMAATLAVASQLGERAVFAAGGGQEIDITPKDLQARITIIGAGVGVVFGAMGGFLAEVRKDDTLTGAIAGAIVGGGVGHLLGAAVNSNYPPGSEFKIRLL